MEFDVFVGVWTLYFYVDTIYVVSQFTSNWIVTFILKRLLGYLL